MTACDEDLLTGSMPHRCIIPEKKNRPHQRSALRKFVLCCYYIFGSLMIAATFL